MKPSLSALLCATLLFSAVACANDDSSWRERRQAPEHGDTAAGTHERSLRFGRDTRNYVLHVPARLDALRPAALVVAMHGGGGHAAFMADDERYGLIGKADREGFVVVFPNGYSKFPRGRLATWNAGACCGDARDRNSDDVGFVRAVVADVQSRVKIDPARVFATGMSNGGMMAYRLACEAADMFRAVASVAGTEAVQECRPSHAVPVLHIHARNDTHVLFNGAAGPDAFRDESKVMDFVSVPDTIARWVGRNRCEARPVRMLETPGAYCERHSGCRNNASVQLCVTEQGGHSWPGAQKARRGKEAASPALDANEVMWAFFESVSAR